MRLPKPSASMKRYQYSRRRLQAADQHAQVQSLSAVAPRRRGGDDALEGRVLGHLDGQRAGLSAVDGRRVQRITLSCGSPDGTPRVHRIDAVALRVAGGHALGEEVAAFGAISASRARRGRRSRRREAPTAAAAARGNCRRSSARPWRLQRTGRMELILPGQAELAQVAHVVVEDLAAAPEVAVGADHARRGGRRSAGSWRGRCPAWAGW